MYSSPNDNCSRESGFENVAGRRFGWRLSLVLSSLLGVASDGLGEDGRSPSRIVVEESLVWRTRIYPRKTTDWTPLGISFGASKPSTFLIEDTAGFPFLNESQRPKVVEGAKAGWSTHGPIHFEQQPLPPELKSDAPQFGLKVVSDYAGLRLTRPTFALTPALVGGPAESRAAWMPDSAEFRFERNSVDSAVFSMRNADPRHVVTFHNLRYAAESAEIELSERILLDQSVPLAHSFTDARQADTPPVVLSKPRFTTFQTGFPLVALPLTLVPGADSGEFSLGELTLGRWIYVEGFATRTERDGRPILDDRGLPEVPSEFRYGFRLIRRAWPKIDLTRYQKWSDDDLFTSRMEGRRGSFSEQTPTTAAAAGYGFPYAGYGSASPGLGGAGGGGSGFGGSSNYGGPGGNVGVSEPLTGSYGRTGLGLTTLPVFGVGTPAPSSSPIPDDPAPTTPIDPNPPIEPATPVSAIPEPSTWIGGLLGALGLTAGVLGKRFRDGHGLKSG